MGELLPTDRLSNTQAMSRSTSDRVSLVTSLASFLAALLVAGVGFAQAGSDEDIWAGVDEMIVVGNPGGATGILKETGSITTFDADDLEAYGIENTADLAEFTPNLEIVSPSDTTATFFIRGVGLQDLSSIAAGAVAIYVDGVPIQSPTLQIAPIFDAAAVEVLKGPQGMGNFRNASAGVIAIRSRKPDLEVPAFDFKTSQGSFVSYDAIDAHIQTYDGGISVPIIPGVLATRFAFKATEKGGIFTNRCAMIPGGSGSDICGATRFAQSPLDTSGLSKSVGDKSVFSLRSSLLFAPPTDVDLEFLGTYFFSRRDQDGTYGQAVGTGTLATLAFGGRTAPGGLGVRPYGERDTIAEFRAFRAQGLSIAQARARFSKNFTRTRPLDKRPYEGDYNKDGKLRVEIMGGTLHSSMTLGDVELNANSGVARLETRANNDSDFTSITLFEILAEDRVTQVSQDLVVSGEIEAFPVRWEVGGFFLWEDLEGRRDTDLAQLENIREFSQDTLSYAFFAGFSVDLLEDFTLSAGARHNTEYKQFKITNVASALQRTAEEERTWREVTGSIELLYRFSEVTSFYFKFNHGFKPGQFNSNGTTSSLDAGTTVRPIARPETIDSFEIGMTGSYWEDRLYFKGALFHYDYQDYQVFLFADALSGPPSLEVVNANDARVLGAEVELRLRPLSGFVPEVIEGLELNARFGWLDSKFLDFQSKSLINPPGAPPPITVTNDFTGNTLLNSPEFSVSGGFSWAFELGRYGTLTPRYDFSWTDEVFFDPTEGRGKTRGAGQLPEGTLGQSAYVTHNVRLGYRPADSGIEVSGWCRNVTDERSKTYAFDASRFRSVVINFVADPRSCGADVSFSW